jgi:Putative 2OG-Fe(II) oxygenase
LPWVGSGNGIPFAPAAGQLLIFPAWLEHRVARFDGTGDRISIAFNATAL